MSVFNGLVQYKTEPHLHVAEVSSCAKIGAEEVIKLYAEAGYSTVFVTDHLSPRAFEKMGELSWEEKALKFTYGYELAKRAGEKYGVNVIFGAELQLCESKNHYLLYGVNKEFLIRNSKIFDMSIAELYALAKKNGITVIHAHPYRDGKSQPCAPEYIDAVEIYNSNPRHENFTELATEFAEKNGLPVTAGSDTHQYPDVAQSGVITPYEIKSSQDYVRAVLGAELEIVKYQ